MSGVLSPIQEISQFCKEKDVRLIVDGTQGVGVVDVNVDSWGIDFLVCSCYKWLMSPVGVAPICVRPDFLDILSPSFRDGCLYKNLKKILGSIVTLLGMHVV